MSDQTPGPEPLKAQIVPSTLANDLLRGIPAIAAYLGDSEPRVYYAAERGLLPLGKLGANWIGSKKALTAYFDKLTNPSLPADDEREPAQVARRVRRRRIA
jgi:hypothetical protein